MKPSEFKTLLQAVADEYRPECYLGVHSCLTRHPEQCECLRAMVRKAMRAAMRGGAVMPEYRIVQGGQVVAGASGESAWREIKHYAMQYAEDGPFTIQEKHGGRWKNKVSWAVFTEVEP